MKTFQARFLLTPNELVNRLIIGVLAMAQEKYRLTVCAVVVMSNHIHLLVVPRSEDQVMRFCSAFYSWPARAGGERCARWTRSGRLRS